MREFVPERGDQVHWDFVLSCFEPVTRVTGGIGSYTRLLLEQLQQVTIDGRPLNVLFFTGERQRSDELFQFCPTATVHFVPEFAHVGRSPLNNLGDPYRHFGYGIMRSMRVMARMGHTFGMVEMPDYSSEGYYVMKAARFGLLNVGATAVRLHSPLFMLHEDNDQLPWCDSSAFRFHDMERYCLEHADQVLYGGDAMLDRVCSLVSPALSAAVREKAVKIPHPWPHAEASKGKGVRGLRRRQRFGYVGRLEFRKGVDLLVEAAIEAMKEVPFELHFFGRDTDTWRQGSMRAHLNNLLRDTSLESRFVFHDYIPQKELWTNHLPKMDGFVFPSRFENYPNVLLEVLGFNRPTLVSQFGCMPEMGAEFGVKAFDPFNRAQFSQLLAATARKPVSPTLRKSYSKVRDEMNETTRRGYSAAVRNATPQPPRRKPTQPSITFVAAHYDQARFLPEFIASLKAEMRAGDEVIIVDDCSSPPEARKAKSLTESAGFKFMTTPVNSGPSVARNLAIRAATTDAIYVIDSDDLLDPDSTKVLRGALANHPEVDVVSGYFQAFEDESHCWAAYDPILETILLENSTHCGLLARRAVFEELGGYHEGQREHFEDWEFSMRLALSEYRVEVLPIISYRYRVRKKSSRNNTQLYRAGYSYEHAVRRALQAIDGKTFNWQRLARFMPTLYSRYQFGSGAPPAPSGAPVDAKVVRYELADRLNLMLKPTPMHGPLKSIAAWSLKLSGL